MYQARTAANLTQRRISGGAACYPGGMDDITAFMRRDHAALDALLALLRRDGPLDPEALDRFRRGLERHIAWEERLLFPAFSRALGSEAEGSVTAMETQHREFIAHLDALRGGRLSDEARRNVLQSLLDDLADHNHAEESAIYPWLDDALDAGTSAAILAALRADA